jgi:hypothetical protein
VILIPNIQRSRPKRRLYGVITRNRVRLGIRKEEETPPRPAHALDPQEEEIRRRSEIGKTPNHRHAHAIVSYRKGDEKKLRAAAYETGVK